MGDREGGLCLGRRPDHDGASIGEQIIDAVQGCRHQKKIVAEVVIVDPAEETVPARPNLKSPTVRFWYRRLMMGNRALKSVRADRRVEATDVGSGLWSWRVSWIDAKGIAQSNEEGDGLG